MTPEALAIESMFQIISKDAKDVPFELNPVQRQLDDEITGRDIIPKARQRGVSSYFLARYTAACMIRRNVRAVVVSHETDATQRLFDRCHYFVNNMRGPNPEVGRSGINVMTFPKTNSQIYIGTAGSRKFGRGDTITHLLCSEYAYWPHPKELLNGLLDAVPQSGEVAVESTGNGVGNDYHRRAIRAAQGLSQWKCHFFSWLDAPEYSYDLSDEEAEYVLQNLNEEWEEPKLVQVWGLTAGQILWRRTKLEEKDYDLQAFKQEFPLTLDECFQASGNSIFHRVNYQPTSMWRKQDAHLYVLDPHPMKGCTYVVGIDPAGGTGGDNSAIEIFCLDTVEQVAEYAYNRIEPDVLGQKAYDLATLFNGAFIVVESNNHGPVTLQALRDLDYPEYLLYSMDNVASGGGGYEDKTLMQLGFRTSVRTRPIMIGKLRTAVAHDWVIHSEMLSDEMSTFIEHENGKMAAQDGCHDDRVMASACAMMGVERAALYGEFGSRPRGVGKTNDPFVVDNIVKEMRSRKGGYPIKPQHAGAWSPGQILTKR